MTAASSAFAWRTRLRADLLTARKARDTVRVSALRSALAAIDNAETPDPTGAQTVAGGGPIAGAVSGVGATEVARRDLDDMQVQNLVRAEIEERLTAAAALPTGHQERAATLRAEAAVLQGLLERSGDVGVS